MEIMPPDTGNRDPQTGTLIRLRGLYPSLKTALRKVADVILRQPEMAIYASVNEVAAVAAVSEATVMRFCRILGFKGFQDFKIALAREMVIPSPARRRRGGRRRGRRGRHRAQSISNQQRGFARHPGNFGDRGDEGGGPAPPHGPADHGDRGGRLRARRDLCRQPLSPAGSQGPHVHRLLPDVDGGLHAVPGRRGAGHLQLGNHPGNRGNGGGSPGKRSQGHVHHQQFPFPAGPDLSTRCWSRLPGRSTLPEEAVASLVCQIAILDALFALIARPRGRSPGRPWTGWKK